ncbi:sugar-binding protein [Halolactibacillus alkaliphilus]|uniref:Sugar-binding protein n=1 Tax=Halolactibacillus alkaliphilus TaxID=442899 RepID=A0A511X2A3_9BACI|nr:extracellular solute-binding protein [Halolactibacillus alkaliphilus]GEN57082.1 sugar-binding protein [Halolactibacillus alkaliphilus]GGN71849.1 sugar-binding protein [Halolactibacillus alkaliphilus]SFO87054.1 raffinose/stachyose/melibiose transport system substrate-binding protein [Halolactibacillus alkaliphilus]
MLKKRILMLAALLLTLLALVACGDDTSQSSEGDSTGEEVVIDFMHLWPEGSSKQHNMIVQTIVDEFETENPGVTVQMEILGNEQYKEKLSVLGSSNDLPDVGMTWGGGFLDPYVSGNMFADLTDIISDSFVPGTTEAYAVDGATYGLPLELNITPVYYNKAIFDAHGVEVPTTLDELKTAIGTLKDAGITPITLGNRDAWTGSMWYMYLADRIGGPTIITDAISGEISFTDDALVQAAEEIQNLVEMDGFINGTNGLGNDEAKGYFINEQAAMYLMATWDLPEWTTNEDNPQEFRDSIGYFKFPTVEGGAGDINSYVGGPGVGLFVAENSDVKDEAKAFVSYFVERWGEMSVQNAGVIPATAVDTSTLDLPQMYIDILNDLGEASNLTLYADVQMSAAAADVHLNMIQALFMGEVTPLQFAENHEKALRQE